MISEPLKRGVLGCLSIVFLLGILFALNNWIGSGPAIKQLKESVDAVDAAQVQNESLNLARIQELKKRLKSYKRNKKTKIPSIATCRARLPHWKARSIH